MEPASDREKDVDCLGHLALDGQGSVGVGVAVAVIALVRRPRGLVGGPGGRGGGPRAGRRPDLDAEHRSLRGPERQVYWLGYRESCDRLTVQQRGRLADALIDPATVGPEHPSMLTRDGRLPHQHIVIGRTADPDQLSGLENTGLAVNLEMKLASRAHCVTVGERLDGLSGLLSGLGPTRLPSRFSATLLSRLGRRQPELPAGRRGRPRGVRLPARRRLPPGRRRRPPRRRVERPCRALWTRRLRSCIWRCHSTPRSPPGQTHFRNRRHARP